MEQKKQLKAIEEAGGQALAVKADVGTEEGVQTLIDQAIKAYGQLDVWVNNRRTENQNLRTN